MSIEPHGSTYTGTQVTVATVIEQINLKDPSELNNRLIDKLKSDGAISTACVEAAFRAVPRHLFLPGVASEEVYQDTAIAIKHEDGMAISSSSQPSLMAAMLEQLELEAGHRVLEIGAASGYNAALMAHIVGEGGHVVTIDIDEDLVQGAREHLAAVGFTNVEAICADGGFGYEEAAPYDRIILTVGAWDIAPAWWGQLRDGGRLVIPLAIKGPQKAIAFQKAGDCLESLSVKDCGFIRLRGAFAGPERTIEIGPEPGLRIVLEGEQIIDREAIYKLLAGPGRDLGTGICATPAETWSGLNLWLALRGNGYCDLLAEGEWVDRGIVPHLYGVPGKRKYIGTFGLLAGDSACFLMRPPHEIPSEEEYYGVPPFELFLRSFGPDDGPLNFLRDQIAAWDGAGRPSTKDIHIRAYPSDCSHTPDENEVVISKQHTQLAISWQRPVTT
ncbi:MAG TPA: methyltransferase, FxLD system [Chloroflexia bacterium]